MGDSAAHRLRDKLKKLHALLGSNNANEREAARAKIDELLAKSKKTRTISPSFYSPGTLTAGRTTSPTKSNPLTILRHQHH